MTSPQAFPTLERGGQGLELTDAGMTLRDYFAANAMQGAFTSPIESSRDGKDCIAMHAYAMADAMLKARKGGEA